MGKGNPEKIRKENLRVFAGSGLRTIKDVYSLPQIEESLDCLNGVCIFMSVAENGGAQFLGSPL